MPFRLVPKSSTLDDLDLYLARVWETAVCVGSVLFVLSVRANFRGILR